MMLLKSIFLGAVLSSVASATYADANRQEILKRRPPAGRIPVPPSKRGHVYADHVLEHAKRQLPPAVTGTTNITSPNGVPIRYKEVPSGICEMNAGVKSYAGYISTRPDRNTFFYFFEARTNKSTAPITMWLNGGPGSSSMIGLFQELGPCSITPNLTAVNNPYSWNGLSHMVFIDQPIGTGFSYGTPQAGVLDDYTGILLPTNASVATGLYPAINATAIDTTDEAAVVAWEVVQAFVSALPSIDSNVTSKQFNLATESYGGHYGPAFFNYFQKMNAGIQNGSMSGVPLTMNSLTVINGIIDEKIQAPYFATMANNNTYGIKAVNDTVYNYMKFSNGMINGCQDQYDSCASVDRSTFAGQAVCTEAGNLCRDTVEGPYYAYSGRGVYDIRSAYGNPELQDNFVDYLNLPKVQMALGAQVNYTESNDDIYWAFQQTGDFVYPNFLPDLVNIVNSGVKVSLVYGDADYICNWFGGQAVSLALNYTNAAQFRAAGYQAMTVNGTEYGETRSYGNFSFTRVYNSGHEVPFYQPIAAYALFERTLKGLNIADGGPTNATAASNGPASATHTSSPVTPTVASSAAASSLSTTSVASSASTSAGNGTASAISATAAVLRGRVFA